MAPRPDRSHLLPSQHHIAHCGNTPLTGWLPIDPLLSLTIAGLIALGAWRLSRAALSVLMEAVPRGIDMPEMVRHMLRVPGVRDVHDLHVWSVGSGLTMLSCHVRIDEQPLAEGLEVIERLGRVLRERFGIAHCTIQPETSGCVTTDLNCALPCGCCDEEPSALSLSHVVQQPVACLPSTSRKLMAEG